MVRRRTVLATGAAAVAGALAGCSTAVGAVAPPDMPESKLEQGGWEQVDESQSTVFKQTYFGQTLTARAHTLVFEDARLRRDIKQETLGRVTGATSIISASHIDFSLDIDSLPIAKSEIMARTEKNARDAFRSRMKDQGLTNVERTADDTLTVNTGETARYTAYRAEYPIDELALELSSGETIRIEAEPLAVQGDLAVWHHGDYVLVAGGAYPHENFAKSVQKQLSDAISVTIDIDLALTPEAYEEEVLDIITAVK